MLAGREGAADESSTEERILDAAETCMSQLGLRRVSMSDVAGQAGVSRGSVYFHFRDRATLVDAVLARLATRFVASSAPASRAISTALSRWEFIVRRGRQARRPIPLLAALHQILDLVLIDKQVGTVFARQSNERVIVILDGTRNLLAIGEFHAHRCFGLDQMLEVSHLFEGLFGSAIPGFSAWS